MIARRRLATLLVALATAATAGCNVSTNDDPVAVEGAFDRIVQSTTTSSTSTPKPDARPVEVYFVRSREGEASELVAVDREVEAAAGVAQVLGNLIPPTPPTEPGLSTAIPESAVLIEAFFVPDSDRLVVNTQGLFGAVRNPVLRNALGQIVCTATELPSVAEVLFQNEGQRVSATVENGQSADRAVRCSDYDALT